MAVDRSPSRRLASACGVFLAAAGASQVAQQVLESRPLAASLASALAVDLIAGWSPPTWHDQRQATPRRFVTELGEGALYAAAALASTVALSLGLGLAQLRAGAPSASAIGLGTVAAAATSLRDEVLYRFMPLALASRIAPRAGIAAFAIAAGAAPLALEPSPRPAAVSLSIAQGLLSCALFYTNDRFAPALGASLALQLGTTVLLTSIADLSLTRGTLVPLARAEGGAAYLLAAALAIAAAVAFVRASRSRDTSAR